MMKSQKIAYLSLLLAIGVILGIFESIYIPPLPVPGAKVGLANIVTILLVMYFSPRDALINVTLRCALVGALTGTFMTTIFFFSLFAGIGAYLVMLVMYRCFSRFLTMVGVSAMGGVAHNMVQLLMAVWLLGTWGVVFHLPLLVLVGVATGAFNGLIANMLQSRADLRPMLEGDNI